MTGVVPEDVWYNTQGEKQVTFRNIPPGKYIFKAETLNDRFITELLIQL